MEEIRHALVLALVAASVPFAMGLLRPARRTGARTRSLRYGRAWRFLALGGLGLGVCILGVLVICWPVIPAKDIRAYVALVALFGGMGAALGIEVFYVRHAYDDEGLDYRSPWSPHRRLNWSMVGRIRWRQAAKWFDFCPADGAPALHLSPMLEGCESLASLALSRLTRTVLDQSPEARKVLALIAEGQSRVLLGRDPIPAEPTCTTQDKYGRDVTVLRSAWLVDRVYAPLAEAWDDAGKLYKRVIAAIEASAANHALPAAEHLYKMTDGDPEAGLLLAYARQQAGDHDGAEQILMALASAVRDTPAAAVFLSAGTFPEGQGRVTLPPWDAPGNTEKFAVLRLRLGNLLAKTGQAINSAPHGPSGLEKAILLSLFRSCRYRVSRSSINFANVEVTDRWFSGAGFMTDFKKTQELRLFEPGLLSPFGDVNALLNTPSTDTGYLFYVENGCITTLECYMQGLNETWPDVITNFQVYYPSEPHCTQLGNAWLEAAKRLSLEVVAPCKIRLSDDRFVWVAAWLRNFGRPLGMVIIEEHAAAQEHLEQFAEAGYGFSVMSEPTRVSTTIIDEFVELLRGWDWSGDPDERPSWLGTPSVKEG